ncbi:putative oxidoreductase protein [Mycena olivaceomarginata]|nr:putative oxidoreductase protein [Mycena olivaceomarginata]
MISVNLVGPFLCAREAVKLFKSQTPIGGRIINNGSLSAHTPRPNSVSYTTSKHAITGLSKCLALDGRAFDITCTQIDIGNARTPMAATMATGMLQPDGRMMPEATFDVAHVAAAVVHIASLPPDVAVPHYTIMASKAPFAGRG